MPIIKSAKKRVRQTDKATIRNAKTKRSLREAVKAFTKALAGGDKAEIAKAQAEAYSALDTAAKKNILHKNKAARRKSQLNKQAKATAEAPAAAKAKAAKKPADKTTKPKAATKKAAVKKPTAPKKATVKKAIKKTAAKK